MQGNKITAEDIREGCIVLHKGDPEETRICTVNEELRAGIDMVSDLPRVVTFFGSARTPSDTKEYQHAQALAEALAEAGYAVVTGGGPGIMEAANRGAHAAGGVSVGFPIRLPMEQVTNPYLTREVPFYYFFTRKVSLSFAADAYVVFPGGFGTIDELSEILTLIQTEKTERVPIILVGSDFWNPLLSFFMSMKDQGYISPDDLSLFTVCDDTTAIIQKITEAPSRIR